MRLQQYLAHAGVGSRRACESLIEAGRVAVNGHVAHIGDGVSEGDSVTLDCKPVALERHVYYMFNKPMFVVTTLSDPQGRRCVGDYLMDIGARVYPVGRLDYDTEGMLLLTNDGALTERLSHPSHGVDKQYSALVRGIPDAADCEALRRGVTLGDPSDTRPARAAYIDVYPNRDGTARVLITIREGRNRVVRRMLDAIAHPVLHLTRVGEGGLELGGLKSGMYRALTDDETMMLNKYS